jgi:hypothetical protein
MTLILGIFIGATIGYITAALMAAPNYSEIPTSSTAKDTDEEGPEINEVLDKIKAEIRPNCFRIPTMYNYGAMIRESDVLFIIDKYKNGDEK